jgi:adhesin/invasin
MWTATSGSSTPGVGTIEIFTGTVSGFAPITLTADLPTTVTLSSEPNSLSVGGGSVLTATVVDQFNNLVSDGTLVTFASDLGNVLSPHLTSGGIATSTITSTLAGTAHITATSNSASGAATVIFTPGAPSTLTLLASPTALTAGGTSVVTATVVDQFDNRVGDGTAVIFSTDLGTVGSSGLTTNGIATSTITSTQTGTAHVTAASGSASNSVPVTFSPGPPASLTLAANPTSVSVGGTSILSATVVDQYNNLVDDGTLVSFASDLGHVLSPHTTSSGIATSTITSTLAGTAHVAATSGAASNSASVTFNPSSPYAMTLLANPDTLAVGGTSILTATVIDQFNNPVANGTSVTFATSRGTVGSPRTTTNGIATSTITSTLAGTAYITATSGSASGFDTVLFNPGPPNTTTLLAIPDTVTVGGTSILTATVIDQFSNPRSEERRVGKECMRPCRSRWSPYH